MPTTWQNVYIFISSTFSDMHAERDYLVKQVFPRLYDWCERRRLRLVDIDLRWGVTEADATRNKNVVQVCLERIDHCRPFFMCFLGQRYGWIPKPEDIDEATFEQFPGLADAVAEQRSVTDLEVLHAAVKPFHADETLEKEGYHPADHAFFYLRDDAYLTGVPVEPHYLRRIYTDADETDGASRDLLVGKQQTLREETVLAAGWPRRLYSAEWLEDQRTPEIAMPLKCPALLDENRSRWREEWLRYGDIQIGDQETEVPVNDVGNAKELNAALTQGRLGSFTCEGKTLGDVIFEDLTKAIEARYPDHGEVEYEGDLQKELDQQGQFIFASSEGFIPRGDDFDELDAYVEGDSDQLFVLTAEAGMGKSMLLANWVEDYRLRTEGDAETTVHCRFVGASDGSTTVHGLLRYLLRELHEIAHKLPDTTTRTTQGADGSETTQEVPLEIPQDPNEIREMWRQQLPELGTKGNTVIVIDALNQLESGLSDVYWLPRLLPPGVKIITSFRSDTEDGARLLESYGQAGDVTVPPIKSSCGEEQRRSTVRAILSKLAAIFKPGDEEENGIRPCSKTGDAIVSSVRPFEDEEDRRKLVRAYLTQYLKELDEQHVEALIHSPGAGNPLYLKVVLSELRVFGAFANLGDKIAKDFGDTPQSAFDAVLARLESDPIQSDVGPSVAVPLLFGLLPHSRRGLAVDELTGLFRMDLGADQGQAVSLRETVQLLLRQVRPYLARRDGRHDFFYESFLNAARIRYVATENAAGLPRRKPGDWHSFLAEHFHGLPCWLESEEEQRERARRVPSTPRPANARKVDALPWHRLEAAQSGEEEHFDALESLLLDWHFLEAKIEAGRIFELAKDFSEAVRTLPAEREGHRLLELIGQAIRRDIHFIARHVDDYPQALFQCLWNSCWWCDSPELPRYLVEPEGGWSAANAPWLRDGPKLCEWMERWQRQFGHTVSPRSRVQTPKTQKPKPKTARPWLRSVRPLTRSIGGPESVRLIGHADCVKCVAVSGGHIVTVSGEGKWANTSIVCVWDAQTGQLLHTHALEGHTDAVISVALSGDRIVSGAFDKTVRVWHARTGQLIHTLEGHTDEVTSVALSGDHVVSGSWDQTVRVWDTSTGQLLHTLEGHTNGVPDVAIEGNRIASGSQDQTVRVWDAHTGQPIYTLEGHTNGVTCVAIEGDRIVSGEGRTTAEVGDTVRVWDLRTGQPIHTLVGHTNGVSCVAIEGDCIVSGSDDNTVRVWDAHTGQPIYTLEGHTDGVTCVAIGGDRIVSGSFGDGTVRMWDAQTEPPIHTLEGHTDGELDVAMSGDRIVSGSAFLSGSDFTVRVWDAQTGQPIHTLEGHTFPGLSVALSGDRIVSGSESARVWDANTGQLLHTLEGHTHGVACVAIEGNRIASGGCGTDFTVCVWDAQTGQLLHTLEGHTSGVTSVALSGDRVVSGAGSAGVWDKIVRVWDANTGQLLHTLEGHTDGVACVALSGDRIVSGSQDQTVRVWDAQAGQLLHTLEGHTSSVTSVVLSGDRIVSESHYETIVWDLETAERLGEGGRSADARAGGQGPYMAKGQAFETAVVDHRGRGLAWFPTKLDHVVRHPDGRSWAGSVNEHLHLICLEDAPDRG